MNRISIVAWIYEETNVFHTFFPLYATQTIDPFLNSRISSNHDKMEEHSPNGEFLKNRLKLYCKVSFDLNLCQKDRAERHDLKPRLWLFFSPILFLPKKRGKKKMRMNSKNCDFKSCLSVRSAANTHTPITL